MTFRPLLLAHPWTAKIDPTGYWMSEKLDGVRAYWDGEGTLFSRNGLPFSKAPDWFIAALPLGIPLDGELYLGPRRFDDTIRAVKGAAGWADLTYRVFDAPDDCKGQPFEARIARAQAFQNDVIRVERQTPCDGLEHLMAALGAVTSELCAGEGIMLRQPGSLYEGKRSRTLLKVKTFLDLDARIVDVIPGKGKHKGRMGALQCALYICDDVRSGTPTRLERFEVGTGFTDAQRELDWTESIGRLATVRYQELTPRGVPRFPVFVSVRDYE
jgi:DNA ligase 1